MGKKSGWIGLLVMLLVVPSTMVIGENHEAGDGLTLTSEELVLTTQESLNMSLNFSGFSDSAAVELVQLEIRAGAPELGEILLEATESIANISNFTVDFSEPTDSFWDGSRQYSATINLLNSEGEIIASIDEYFAVFEQSGALNPSKFVVFGDSLSDQGNVAAFTGYIKSPPYWGGRISNGPVWVEWTGAGFGITMERGIGDLLNGTNRAWGGAAAGEGYYQGVVMNAGPQIEDYLRNNDVSDSDLFAIWIGGNNFLQGATETQYVVDLIIGHLETLDAAGATRIIVMNLPNMDITPYYSELTIEEVNDAIEGGARYNSQLRHDVIAVNARTNAVIQLVEINKMFDEMADSPEYYHITEIAKPVCEFEGELCVGSPDSTPPSDGHLFFDSVHPTELAHKILGKAIHEIISTADYDADGVGIEADLCPNTPSNSTVNTDGCAQSESDDDRDGIMNDVDQCTDTPASASEIDDYGCAVIVQEVIDEFQCENGDMISNSSVMDGNVDCADGSDENALQSTTKKGVPAIGIFGILFAVTSALIAIRRPNKKI